MVNTYICLVFLVVFISIAGSKKCDFRTLSGAIEKLCCGDYEANGNDCVACSKGYTSRIGQNCMLCPKNTYGERCRYECYCSGLEICDHVKGCVTSLTTYGKSAYDTLSDRSLIAMTTPATHSRKDITISYRQENTTKQCTGCSSQGLLSRELIVYTALSVLVIGCGICSCSVFLTYKILTKKYIVTVSQTRNFSMPQQIQTHEIVDRLYDIINDEDILDDRSIQQRQMSSNYLDVIHDPNNRESCESKIFENQDNPCQLLSVMQTQNREHNLKVDSRSLMSGDSTSSSDEYQWDSTQDYLNPYQPMIEISPPAENKYLTIATAHSSVDGDYTDSAIVRYEYELQHSREVKNKAYTNDNYEHSSVSFGSNESKSILNKKGVKESESYENLMLNGSKCRQISETRIKKM